MLAAPGREPPTSWRARGDHRGGGGSSSSLSAVATVAKVSPKAGGMRRTNSVRRRLEEVGEDALLAEAENRPGRSVSSPLMSSSPSSSSPKLTRLRSPMTSLSPGHERVNPELRPPVDSLTLDGLSSPAVVALPAARPPPTMQGQPSPSAVTSWTVRPFTVGADVLNQIKLDSHAFSAAYHSAVFSLFLLSIASTFRTPSVCAGFRILRPNMRRRSVTVRADLREAGGSTLQALVNHISEQLLRLLDPASIVDEEEAAAAEEEKRAGGGGGGTADQIIFALLPASNGSAGVGAGAKTWGRLPRATQIVMAVEDAPENGALRGWLRYRGGSGAAADGQAGAGGALGDARAATLLSLLGRLHGATALAGSWRWPLTRLDGVARSGGQAEAAPQQRPPAVVVTTPAAASTTALPVPTTPETPAADKRATAHRQGHVVGGGEKACAACRTPLDGGCSSADLHQRRPVFFAYHLREIVIMIGTPGLTENCLCCTMPIRMLTDDAAQVRPHVLLGAMQAALHPHGATARQGQGGEAQVKK
jgi:hypothetical protein